MQACITPQTCRCAPTPRSASTAALPKHAARHLRRLPALHSVSQETVASTSAAAASQQPASSAQELHPEAWQQCVHQVQGLGFDETDAAVFIQRAFGWGAKARSYWRHEKKEAAPDPAQITAVLEFLQQDLGMDGMQVSKTVKAFPEVLGCAVSSQLQGNVAKLQKEWKLEGQVLRGAVLRNPGILGYNVDCLGDCAGECNRCWVRF